MRTLQIEQVRFRRGLEGDFSHIFQNGRVHSANGRLLDHGVRVPIRRRVWSLLTLFEMVTGRLRRGCAVSVFQIQDAGLFGSAQGIMYSAHRVP